MIDIIRTNDPLEAQYYRSFGFKVKIKHSLGEYGNNTIEFEIYGVGLKQIKEFYKTHKKRVDIFIIERELKDLYKQQ